MNAEATRSEDWLLRLCQASMNLQRRLFQGDTNNPLYEADNKVGLLVDAMVHIHSRFAYYSSEDCFRYSYTIPDLRGCETNTPRSRA